MMEQGICKNCINQFVVNENQLGGTTCSLNNKIYPPNVYNCNFFKAKPTALEEVKRVQEENKNSELKQQAKKALDKKGQTIDWKKKALERL